MFSFFKANSEYSSTTTLSTRQTTNNSMIKWIIYGVLFTQTPVNADFLCLKRNNFYFALEISDSADVVNALTKQCQVQWMPCDENVHKILGWDLGFGKSTFRMDISWPERGAEKSFSRSLLYSLYLEGPEGSAVTRSNDLINI